MDDKYYMKLAIDEAQWGIECNHGGPFGCVIVKDGEIIAIDHNRVIQTNDVTAHGEMQAIRRACQKLHTFDLSGCELYTTGYPCPMCMAAIRWANISKVYFGCSTTDTESIGFRDKLFETTDNSDSIEFVECCREDCLGLYDEYKNMSNKINY